MDSYLIENRYKISFTITQTEGEKVRVLGNDFRFLPMKEAERRNKINDVKINNQEKVLQIPKIRRIRFNFNRERRRYLLLLGILETV